MRYRYEILQRYKDAFQAIGHPECDISELYADEAACKAAFEAELTQRFGDKWEYNGAQYVVKGVYASNTLGYVEIDLTDAESAPWYEIHRMKKALKQLTESLSGNGDDVAAYTAPLEARIAELQRTLDELHAQDERPYVDSKQELDA